jgi:transcriptional regulator with XRE-family HTH domain
MVLSLTQVASQLRGKRHRANKRRMLDPAQLRAARALLDWSRQELADRSNTARETVQAFEARGSNPKRSTLIAWERALRKGGVVFIESDEQLGPGVRLRERRQ